MAVPLPKPRPLPEIILSSPTTKDLLAAGVRKGELERVRHGAYLPVIGDLPRWQRTERHALARIVALSRQLSDEHVFSHSTAALIHGLPIWTMEQACHVFRPYNPSSRSAADLRPHTGTLPPDDVTVVNGLRVTTLLRTVEDCALTLPAREAMVIADAALRTLGKADRFRQGMTRRQVEEVRAVLSERLARRRRARGIRRARAVIAHADGFAESAPESAARWLAVSRGLPPPTTQFRVETALGTYYVDMTWVVELALNGRPAVTLVHLEIDGASKYSGGTPGEHSAKEATRRVFEEKRRQDAILERGGVMRRLTTPDLVDAGPAFARLSSAFPRAFVAGLRPNLMLWPDGGAR
ncbi:type IV toxin-antitoxin system AbiEi family antitoxin domain-containing protein, partial [Georgenia sp.]